MNTTLNRFSLVGIFFLIISMFCIFFATPLFVAMVSAQAPTSQPAPVPVMKTTSCSYDNSSGKAACISSCTGKNSSTKDVPNALNAGISGVIQCTFESLANNIPATAGGAVGGATGGAAYQATSAQQDCYNALGTWDGTKCTNIPATTGGVAGSAAGATGGTAGGATGGTGGGGAKYTPLVGIPGISGTPSLPDYINKIYILIIAIGVLLAVIKIAYAGVKYSMSGVVTDKAEAKKDIQGVLLGLALLLLPALVLNTINPDLLRLNFLDGLTKLDISSTSKGNQGGVSTNTGGASVPNGSVVSAQAPTSQQACWDALGTWNGTQCTNLPASSGGATGGTTGGATGGSAGGAANQPAPVPVMKTTSCSYDNSSGKAACISSCTGKNSSTKDVPNALNAGISGVIQCTFESLANNIP